MNIAIRAAQGTFVLCTDADMMFEPNYVTTVLFCLEQDDRQFVVCRCLDLPESLPEQAWAFEDFPRLRTRAAYRETKGTGACQATRRDWFVRVRGYDEKYVFWGFEDTDMLRRAQRDGLRTVWIHEQTSMLHQWHPTDNGTRPALKYKNKLRFWLTRGIVRKNSANWGEASV
jgi:GT2 family glycosyltransferase